MILGKIASIQSGYISRTRIEPDEGGSHLLLQASDVDGAHLSCCLDSLTRFKPHLSPSDWILQNGDILFMARGFRNFSISIQEIPENVLAAACFFIIRAKSEKVFHEYLRWYLNQPPVMKYLRQKIGRGVNMPIVRRAVLEGVDVPLPPMQTQRNVAKLNELLADEQDLLTKLADKRKKLIERACLKAVREPER